MDEIEELLRGVVADWQAIYDLKARLTPACEPTEDLLLTRIELNKAKLELLHYQQDYPRRP